MMLMPAAGVDSSSLMAASPASTVLTPTSASTICTVTPSIQPLQQKDTTWTKLFVGGLPYHTTDKSLRDHFEVYGDIEEAVVITDRSTGKSRGYGFVIMATKEAAERACKEPNPIIDGRKANVNLAILGAKPRGNITGSSLPLTALRPGFPTILPTQFGQGVPAATAAAAAGSPYLQQLYTAGTPYMHPSLLNLAAGLTTGYPHHLPQQYHQPSPGPASYLPIKWSDISPNNKDPYSGNPFLDIYGQYAAAAAAAGMMPATAASQTVTQQAMVPCTPGSVDSNPMMAGQYFSYAYAPLTAQQLTAAGLPYAAASGPTPAAAVAGQPQPTAPTETRIQ